MSALPSLPPHRTPDILTTIPMILETMEYGPDSEDSTLAMEWLDRHDRVFGHWIEGRWTQPVGTDSTEVRARDSVEVLAGVACGSHADADRAARAAESAWKPWCALGGSGRAGVLLRLADSLQRHARLVGAVETLDGSRPGHGAGSSEPSLSAGHVRQHAGWAQIREREFPGLHPHGVVVQVFPSNAPLLLLLWSLAPALAAGNTVVLKPGKRTPLSGLLLADLCADAGVPGGVVNVLTGDRDTGTELVAHPLVRMVSLVGSREVGREVRCATAGSGKRLSLQLDGETPCVVFDDADLDAVVDGIADALRRSIEQAHPCSPRILVQESVAEPLDSKLQHRIGPPGGTTRHGSDARGLMEHMTVFRTLDEAVEFSSDPCFGLAASIWTENVNVALDVAGAVRAPTVWVNCANLYDPTWDRHAGEVGHRDGRELLLEYLQPEGASEPEGIGTEHRPTTTIDESMALPPADPPAGEPISIDRTPRLYIGGRQTRSDAGRSMRVQGPSGKAIAELPSGDRSDVRRAVEAARTAFSGWTGRKAHQRTQVLRELADNLEDLGPELASQVARDTGLELDAARVELVHAADHLRTFAAMADRHEGRLASTPFRTVTLARVEPLGVLAIAAPVHAPLLGLVATIAPAVAMGNTVVAVPSSDAPLVIRSLARLLDTSDVPAGVVNLLSGPRRELVDALAENDGVDGVWSLGGGEEGERVERLSARTLKRTRVWDPGIVRSWLEPIYSPAEDLLRQATRVKSIHVPCGA